MKKKILSYIAFGTLGIASFAGIYKVSLANKKIEELVNSKDTQTLIIPMRKKTQLAIGDEDIPSDQNVRTYKKVEIPENIPSKNDNTIDNGGLTHTLSKGYGDFTHKELLVQLKEVEALLKEYGIGGLDRDEWLKDRDYRFIVSFAIITESHFPGTTQNLDSLSLDKQALILYQQDNPLDFGELYSYIKSINFNVGDATLGLFSSAVDKRIGTFTIMKSNPDIEKIGLFLQKEWGLKFTDNSGFFGTMRNMTTKNSTLVRNIIELRDTYGFHVTYNDLYSPSLKQIRALLYGPGVGNLSYLKIMEIMMKDGVIETPAFYKAWRNRVKYRQIYRENYSVVLDSVSYIENVIGSEWNDERLDSMVEIIERYGILLTEEDIKTNPEIKKKKLSNGLPDENFYSHHIDLVNFVQKAKLNALETVAQNSVLLEKYRDLLDNGLVHTALLDIEVFEKHIINFDLNNSYSIQGKTLLELFPPKKTTTEDTQVVTNTSEKSTSKTQARTHSNTHHYPITTTQSSEISTLKNQIRNQINTILQEKDLENKSPEKREKILNSKRFKKKVGKKLGYRVNNYEKWEAFSAKYAEVVNEIIEGFRSNIKVVELRW